MTLKNKKILIIIGGGIAAYKSLDLIRLLRKENVKIKTILTKSGKEFVTPLSLTTLTKSRPHENMFDKNSEAEIDHIALSRWADLIIVMHSDIKSLKHRKNELNDIDIKINNSKYIKFAKNNNGFLKAETLFLSISKFKGSSIKVV